MLCVCVCVCVCIRHPEYGIHCLELNATELNTNEMDATIFFMISKF